MRFAPPPHRHCGPTEAVCPLFELFPRKRESSTERPRGVRIKNGTKNACFSLLDSCAPQTRRSWIPAFAGMTRFLLQSHVVFALILAPLAAQAGDVKIQPIFNQVGSWDSNPLMLTRDEKSVYGSTTSPRLTITNETPLSAIKADARVDQNLFSDSDYNSTDLHGSAELMRRNERWGASFRGNADYDTTRTSELTNFGRNVGKVRHFGYSVGPEISFTPTQLDRIALGGTFQKSTYKSDAYSDYTVLSLSPSYTRSLTPLTSGIFSVQAQRFRSERDPKRRVDSIGPSAGFMTNLTPTISLSANAGSQASQERISGEPEQNWKWHYVYSATMDFKGDQNKVTLKASRAREPFGNGTDSLLTTFGLDNNHDLNKSFTWSLGASYQFADYDGTTNRNLDSMASGRTGLSYHMTKTFDLTASYQYKNEKLTDGGDRAEQNVARIGLTYRPELD